MTKLLYYLICYSLSLVATASIFPLKRLSLAFNLETDSTMQSDIYRKGRWVQVTVAVRRFLGLLNISCICLITEETSIYYSTVTFMNYRPEITDKKSQTRHNSFCWCTLNYKTCRQLLPCSHCEGKWFVELRRPFKFPLFSISLPFCEMSGLHLTKTICKLK